MDANYRETLTERCKEVAKLQLELEKERQRVEIYQKAMASHSQQLMEKHQKLNLVNPCLG